MKRYIEIITCIGKGEIFNLLETQGAYKTLCYLSQYESKDITENYNKSIADESYIKYIYGNYILSYNLRLQTIILEKTIEVN